MTSNESALFQDSVAKLCSNLFMTSAPDPINYGNEVIIDNMLLYVTKRVVLGIGITILYLKSE